MLSRCTLLSTHTEFTIILRVDSPVFSTIVLFKNQLFPWVFDGFLKRRIPGKNGEGSPRIIAGHQLGSRFVGLWTGGYLSYFSPESVKNKAMRKHPKKSDPQIFGVRRIVLLIRFWHPELLPEQWLPTLNQGMEAPAHGHRAHVASLGWAECCNKRKSHLKYYASCV